MNNTKNGQYNINDFAMESSIFNTVSTKNEENIEPLAQDVIITREQCSGTRDNYLYAFGIEESEEQLETVTEGDGILS